jgi:hypothetical protein
MSWTQVSGRLSALPAQRGEERGVYMWIDAGERSERIVAELFLPAVSSAELDGALGVAVGTVRVGDADRTGDVRLQFGRVRDGRGVLTAAGAGIDADIRFELSPHPPEGGYCRHCGAELVVEVVAVITPPDGGVIGTPSGRCGACGER